MPSNEFKRSIRAYAAEHGISYTAAHRILSGSTRQPATPDRVHAQVTVTASDDGAHSPRRWTILVDDARTEKPIAAWIYRQVEERVDELADAAGWRRAPGAVWPVELTSEPVEVALERSDIGQRNDQAEKILAEAGLSYHRAHEPYIAAVAYELNRAGIKYQDFYANPDEPRDGAIELTQPLPGYEETHIAWREDHGWYYIPTSDRSNALGDYTVDLPVGHLAVPHEVAVAVGEALNRPVSTLAPDWKPPADYNAEAVASDDWFDASPDLERALTCYTSYPGWEPAA